MNIKVTIHKLAHQCSAANAHLLIPCTSQAYYSRIWRNFSQSGLPVMRIQGTFIQIVNVIVLCAHFSRIPKFFCPAWTTHSVADQALRGVYRLENMKLFKCQHCFLRITTFLVEILQGCFSLFLLHIVFWR